MGWAALVKSLGIGPDGCRILAFPFLPTTGRSKIDFERLRGDPDERQEVLSL